MKCPCNDLTASTTAKILSINRNAINRYFKEFRIRILEDFIKNTTKNSKNLNLMKITLEPEECKKNGLRRNWQNTCF